MKLLIATVLVLVSSHASALTDFKCESDCMGAGSGYNFCHDRCTVPDNNFGTIKQVDYPCMNRCSADGYQYNFCQNKCSN